MGLSRRDGIKKLLDLKAGVLDVCAGYDFDSPDTDGVLPSSVKSSAAAFGHGRRTLVYQVIHEIRPLWLLESAEEFKSCYVDLLRAHFHAYDPDRVLHRDISATSALARLRPDGKVAGLLNDWDLTCAVEGEGLGQQLAPQLRSGSTIFMAIDLQRRAGGKYAVTNHRYCHDLESFFWLLVWAVLHFDLNNKRHLDCNMSADWNGGWAESSFFKVDLLDSGYTMDGVLQNTLNIWQDVVECWVKPLACLLDTARQSSTKWVDKRRKVFDVNAYANELTFEAFVQTIEQLPRTRALEEA
ncbi:uncharacterized protein SCHCODRAFT_02692445 [Schizophyllum commune H4-8]|nr:uncharacterized protein SCHCODRAFT_02692445 [Schizophyllum commune H4-8]KAI5887841.1 hypothetical protein SCHCODRAFT_02692445 [Schizophyllum commune H4-8]